MLGAHTALLVRAPPSSSSTMRLKHCHFSLFLISLLLHILASLGASDSEILLQFKKSLEDNGALSNWKDSTPTCTDDMANWVGVLCSDGKIWGIQLENMVLKGVIDVVSLKKLPDLRTLSFMNNNFNGPLPDIKQMGALKSVYLSNNQFSGDIPKDAFEDMNSLKKLYLANNKLTGTIPSSIASLPKLMELRLEGNQFQGQIPEFKQKSLKLDVSNNALEGSIPVSLSKIDMSSFQGNKALCGHPLEPCQSSSQSPPQSPPQTNASSNKNKPSTLIIIIVAIAVVLTLIAISVVIYIMKGRSKASDRSLEAGTPTNLAAKDMDTMSETASQITGNNRRPDNIKLSFIRDDGEKFDMQDLLKASAEVLGSGCFGSSYKASLCNGQMMVVKRFKQMNNVGKEEFQEHMRRLGRLRHPNLLPLVAYYYRKEEKLLVSDYIENGSLAVLLHGSQAQGQSRLDWPARLKIVKGVARGFAYLYAELPSLTTPHGNIKSSNVLVNKSMEPLITDYGLIPVVNQEHAQDVLVAYKSPEYVKHGRITKKTDVWGLGMFILEILTGRLPANFLRQGKGESESDLGSLVNKIVEEEGTSEVFDKEMGGKRNSEGEMMKLLKIGLECCGEVEKRMDMKEVIERIEELRERDNDDDYYSAIDGDARSTRALSDDFSNINLQIN